LRVVANIALRSRAFDPHAALREATHATHMRLHGLPQFTAIAEGRLDRADYVELLKSLHAYHRTIAGAASRGRLTHLSSSPRRMEMLGGDLASLGASPARRERIWPPSSSEALLGAIYVAEGSALGGRVIARQLDYLFGEETEGRTFFHGDGETGPHWRAFLAAVKDDCAESGMPEMVAGAEASFALFEACVAA
jgi:heme oxygenase